MYNLIKDDETLDDLQLNGIKVIQKKKAFRFGIDAVLLANFAKIKKGSQVIDLCSGTGIIPFIIAAKTKASKIIGLEIQEQMVEMSTRTVKFNNLQDRVCIIKGDLTEKSVLKQFSKADIVTVNPPYKLKNTGVISLDNKNAIARHEICCTLEDVIIAAKFVLKDRGKLYMVHRPDRLVDILYLMRKHKIEPKVIRMVCPNCNKAPNMILIEGQKNSGIFLKWQPNIYIYNEMGEYTNEIKRIYSL